MSYLAKYFPLTLEEYYLKQFKLETVSRHAWKIAAILFHRALLKFN